MPAKALRLVEPVPIEDDLCTGLGLIENIGLGARFVLYAEQTCYETGGPLLVVKRKIVLPTHAIRPGIELALSYLTNRAKMVACAELMQLVR